MTYKQKEYTVGEIRKRDNVSKDETSNHISSIQLSDKTDSIASKEEQHHKAQGDRPKTSNPASDAKRRAENKLQQLRKNRNRRQPSKSDITQQNTSESKRSNTGKKANSSKRNKIRGKKLELDKSHLKENLIFWDDSAQAMSMPYKILRTKVYQQLQKNKWNSIGITSPNPEEGKSITTINLAFAFAHSIENHVLLIDLDFHRPSIHKKLGFSPRYGLIDYLTGDIPISEILFGIPGSNCIVIPGRDIKSIPHDLLRSDRIKKFHKLINQLLPACYIFYDMPPVLAVDDAITFKIKDSNLIVVSENTTSVNDLNHTIELLSDQHITGYALNKSKNRSRMVKNGYYYYGEYGGYDGYSKYSKATKSK